MLAEQLVSTDWLAEHLRDPKSARGRHPRIRDDQAGGSRGRERRRTGAPARNTWRATFPGAVYIDWTTDITDPDDPVPVQIAPPARFAEAMAARGIGDGTTVIAVDHAGGQFATRLWWALRYYGHDNVARPGRRLESLG